ncbi:MAG: glucoamylase family protein [Gemmatimonadaceae bacterium]
MSRVYAALSTDDDAILDRLQRNAFQYFLNATNPVNGLVADTSREGSPSSIAVCGFAMSCYPIAVERGWILRADAVTRTLTLLRFLRDGDQSGSADATGYKGLYYHFLDMNAGQRMWRSELSLIDSALLLAGALVSREYFTEDSAAEHELRDLVDFLYRRVDWRWSQDRGAAISHGWKPESGFLNYGWEGYSEAILLYVLAMGSPTLPATGNCYAAWTATYQWENLYGQDFLYAGPLFVHQFSHAWIDFRGIRDAFMREKKSDYFENSKRAVLVQQKYCELNPHGFTGYGTNVWGLTACDGPNDGMSNVGRHSQRLFGYAARGVPYGPDDGTIGGWSALASLPFAPEIAMRAARTMLAENPEIVPDGMYSSSVNATLAQQDGRAWVSSGHFGLDQGIMVMMIENYRSGLIWRLMRGCEYIRKGLAATGFRGGWL